MARGVLVELLRLRARGVRGVRGGRGTGALAGELVEADAADASTVADALAAFDFGPRVARTRVIDRPGRPARRATAAFESLAAAVRLALALGARHDWFVAIRLDVTFFSSFDLGVLDARLLYVAHMWVLRPPPPPPPRARAGGCGGRHPGVGRRCIPQNHTRVVTRDRVFRFRDFWPVRFFFGGCGV